MDEIEKSRSFFSRFLSYFRLPPSASRHSSRRSSIVLRIARLILITYLAVLAFLFAIQKLLIFPGHSTQGSAASVVHPIKGMELVNLTTRDGEKIVALFGGAMTEDDKPRKDAAQRPTVLYFYGNGMSLNDCIIEFNSFRRLGVNVMIPEYVGYGMSSGSPTEAGCYASADAAYDYLLARGDINKEKIVAAGWSLGGAVAIDLAARRKVAGLVTFSTFTSINDMGKRLYWFMPVGLILRYRFDSDRKIGKINVPILIAHGRNDSVVPWQMSGNLAALAGGPVTKFDIDSADHGDIFDIGGKKLAQVIADFLGKI